MPIRDLVTLVQTPTQEPHWVVKGILPRGSMTVLAGEAGTGKSLLCYHLSLCAALGLPFLGTYATCQTRVLYIDEENGLPDATRYWQWSWRGAGCPDPATLRAITFAHMALGHAWESTLLTLAKTHQPGLIIIDTATPALQIIDENDNAEASRKIQTLRTAQAAADNETAIVVLKHAKVQDEKGHRRTIRGAKTWLGSVDSVLFHSYNVGRPGKLRQTLLTPDKVRAFGLDHSIKITPSWTAADEPKGLVLKGSVVTE